jgi:peptidoglycan/LPS O-acetylase OafA/YrhL
MGETQSLSSPPPLGALGPSSKGYIPTLDGWRAVAILPVLIAHYTPFISFMPQRLNRIGGAGVSIFFGISGLLICTLLLRERDLTGRIDLKGFYLRRCFRILPVAWLYLITIAVVRHFADLETNNTELWASALFLRNYIGSNGGPTVHYWSLAIEEHFYLILPVFLAIYGSRRTRDLCIGVAVAVCGWRWFNAIHPIGNQVMHFYRTDLRFDALFDGALAAILLHDERIRSALHRAGPWKLYAVAGVAFLGSLLIPSPTLNRSLVALSIPLVLLTGVLFPKILLARALEAHWLRWIGRVSYSIYIWQGLFTSNELHLLWGRRFWALNLLAMFGTAVASYYLLERPLIRWGHRLRRSANQGRSDLQ